MRWRGWGVALGSLAVAIAATGVSIAAVERDASGWSLRVSYGGGFGVVDPAQFPGFTGQPLEWALCANLTNYRDAGGALGAVIYPEVASALPRLSKDRRTYTFKLRRGFRFSSGAPVTAESFARAIDRALNPQMSSPGAAYVQDVVGAADVLAGRTTHARGVRADGRSLVVRLTHAAPDFPARMALSYFCAVPASTPFAPTTPASAGPYAVTELSSSRLVLTRNRYYRGTRPHGPRTVEWLLNQPFDSIALQIARGDADYGFLAPATTTAVAKQYPRQFHRAPGIGVACLALNSDRPLFHGNPSLRRAVNFAIDRRALAAQYGELVGATTDQYLAHTMPGFADAKIYPLRAPNLRRARALAAGHLGTGKAIMLTRVPVGSAFARAQEVQRDLARIGISVEIRLQDPQSPPETRGGAYDILDTGCVVPAYADPAATLNPSFDGQLIRPAGNTNVAYYSSPRFNRLLARDAQLTNGRRYAAYTQTDALLARDGAPAVAYAEFRQTAFVSQRIGCVRLNPVNGISFGALCLRNG